MKTRFFIALVALVAFFAGLWLLQSCQSLSLFWKAAPVKPSKNEVIWYVLNASDAVNQADANLLTFGSGESILIDAGQTTNRLAPQLKRLGVQSLTKILISHPHKDHYNGIFELVDAGIHITTVHLNFPPQSICDREIPWGCDMKDLERLKNALKAKKISLIHSKAGDIYMDQENFNLKTIYAHDGVSPPVGDTDINDLSVILSLTVGKTKALFTGDLNQQLGGFLAEAQNPDFKAQLLKVPHHGTDSLAPDSFFAWVNPEAAFVPAPEALWLSDGSRRARAWFLERKIPTFVTGKSGMVKVTISPLGYKITSEKTSDAKT